MWMLSVRWVLLYLFVLDKRVICTHMMQGNGALSFNLPHTYTCQVLGFAGKDCGFTCTIKMLAVAEHIIWFAESMNSQFV